jgi:hypothetical protein
MGDAIGGSLPMAIGVALSPLPVIAVVLMLTTERARVNGPVFVLGWLSGLAVIGAIVLTIAGHGGASHSGSPATWASWLKIALGVLLAGVAVRQFRGRPRGDQQPAMPRWMRSVDTIRPPTAYAVAAGLAAANPKNLLLAVGAATTIAQTGISGGEQAIGYAVFAVIGALGVGAPVLLYLAMGERSARLLTGLKDWMGRNNAVIMAVLCLVIGAKLIGDAVGALT